MKIATIILTDPPEKEQSRFMTYLNEITFKRAATSVALAGAQGAAFTLGTAAITSLVNKMNKSKEKKNKREDLQDMKRHLKDQLRDAEDEAVKDSLRKKIEDISKRIERL